MDRRIGATVVLVSLLGVAGALAPIHFSYVYSDSMAPTLHQNDAYLVYETDDVAVGDVIVFRSRATDSYVTHRVVGDTPAGYVTKGDGNPSTDQAAGYDHVQDAAIVGRVITVGGSPVRIPWVGWGIAVIRSNHWLVLALAAGALLVHASRSAPDTARSITRVEDVVRPLFLAALLTTVALSVTAGQETDLSYVAVEGNVDGPRTVQVGQGSTETVRLTRPGIPGTTVVATGEGVAVTNRTANATTIEYAIHIPPPTEPGPHGGTLTVTRYPAVLPRSVLTGLHAIHPVASGIATGVVLLAPVYLAYLLTVDGRTPIRPSKRRWIRKLVEEDQ